MEHAKPAKMRVFSRLAVLQAHTLSKTAIRRNKASTAPMTLGGVKKVTATGARHVTPRASKASYP